MQQDVPRTLIWGTRVSYPRTYACCYQVMDNRRTRTVRRSLHGLLCVRTDSLFLQGQMHQHPIAKLSKISLGFSLDIHIMKIYLKHTISISPARSTLRNRPRSLKSLEVGRMVPFITSQTHIIGEKKKRLDVKLSFPSPAKQRLFNRRMRRCWTEG